MSKQSPQKLGKCVHTEKHMINGTEHVIEYRFEAESLLFHAYDGNEVCIQYTSFQDVQEYVKNTYIPQQLHTTVERGEYMLINAGAHFVERATLDRHANEMKVWYTQVNGKNVQADRIIPYSDEVYAQVVALTNELGLIADRRTAAFDAYRAATRGIDAEYRAKQKERRDLINDVF